MKTITIQTVLQHIVFESIPLKWTENYQITPKDILSSYLTFKLKTFLLLTYFEPPKHITNIIYNMPFKKGKFTLKKLQFNINMLGAEPEPELYNIFHILHHFYIKPNYLIKL